jgi:hypothetical protein
MGLSTKEKSKQKRKGVNNQNNSVELFPVINTQVTLSLYQLNLQLRKTIRWY